MVEWRGNHSGRRDGGTWWWKGEGNRVVEWRGNHSSRRDGETWW